MHVHLCGWVWILVVAWPYSYCFTLQIRKLCCFMVIVCSLFRQVCSRELPRVVWLCHQLINNCCLCLTVTHNVCVLQLWRLCLFLISSELHSPKPPSKRWFGQVSTASINGWFMWICLQHRIWTGWPSDSDMSTFLKVVRFHAVLPTEVMWWV